MRRIEQEHENGCGVACVAMLAGVTYRHACIRMFPDGRGGRCSGDQIIRMTLKKHYDIRLGKRRRLKDETFNDLQQDGLLEGVCHWRGSSRWGHWVVWDAKKKAILDPSCGTIAERWTHFKAFYPVLPP